MGATARAFSQNLAFRPAQNLKRPRSLLSHPGRSHMISRNCDLIPPDYMGPLRKALFALTKGPLTSLLLGCDPKVIDPLREAALYDKARLTKRRPIARALSRTVTPDRMTPCAITQSAHGQNRVGLALVLKRPCVPIRLPTGDEPKFTSGVGCERVLRRSKV